MTFRTDWVVDSHPAILDGFVTMFRKELEAQKEQEQPFVKQFYVVENMQAAPLKIERFGNLDDAMSQYQALPNHYMKNYNMIDGCVNNVPKKPRRIGGRWSVLDRLHIKQAERRQKDNAPQQEQERSRKS